ncbi:MAG: exonuclease SbcCD subunit D C-terminal domain-containing protein [Treponema sp.]|nr:exonuclease SbcCD subunit D C-terminal domain-containing protein [Treponema sp.]
MSIKVLHTSDWHLGAILHNEDRKDEHEQFLLWLLETIKTENIDVLVISGDIFDVYAPSASAQKLYYDFLAGAIKLKNAPEVFIIAGNHDSRLFLDAPSAILSKLKIHIVSAVDTEKPEKLIFEINGKTEDAQTGLVICAIPFLREKDLSVKPGTSDFLSAQYNAAAGDFYHKAYEAARTKNAPVLMTGHFYLDGSKKSDDYSERTREVGNLRGLPAAALPDADYYALGHLHRSQAVSGAAHIRYSGSPLSMSFDEASSAKYVVILSFDGGCGTKPEIQLKEIPVWQELRQIKGKPDEILRELEKIRESGKAVWIEIQVTEYDGDLSKFWNNIDNTQMLEAAAPAYKILVKQDMRVRQNSGDWRGEEGGDLSSLDPVSVFKKFLDEEKIDAENTTIFLKMFNELYTDVIVNENGLL